MAIGEMGDAYGVPEMVASMQRRIVLNQPTTVAPTHGNIHMVPNDGYTLQDTTELS